MLQEMCTRCSTISTRAILEEWPRQEFWDRRRFYLGKLYGTHCFQKIKFRLLLFLFEQVGYIIILQGNAKRLSFSKKSSPKTVFSNLNLLSRLQWMYLHLHVHNLLYAAVVGNVLFTNTCAQKMLNSSFFFNFQMLILLRVENTTKRLF